MPRQDGQRIRHELDKLTENAERREVDIDTLTGDPAAGCGWEACESSSSAWLGRTRRRCCPTKISTTSPQRPTKSRSPQRWWISSRPVRTRSAYSAFHSDNAYYYPTARIRSRRVRTDTVSNTAFRGFGGPQGMLFAERMMDAIAITLGLDALVVRKRNLYAPGRDMTPYGMRVEVHVVTRIVRRLERTSGYAARRRAITRFNARAERRRGRGGTLRKGIALTPVKFGIAFTLKQLNQAGALVHVFTDGSVQVNHGGTEMGQGLYIKVAQVVAEEFGIGIDRVRSTATRTDKVPNTAPTAASSGSDLNGMAAQRAARIIRRRLAGLAARLHQVREADVVFRDGMVRIGAETIPFERLTQLAFTERASLSSTGYYATPKISWDRDTASGRPFL